jgi:hypothetical protein
MNVQNANGSIKLRKEIDLATKENPMAHKLDDNEIVSFKELLMANSMQVVHSLN